MTLQQWLFSIKGRIGRRDFWYPDVEAGLHGVYWVEQCVKSADAGSQWVDFTLP